MIQRDIAGKNDPFRLRLPLQNRDFRLEVGGLNVGDESPLESGAQPLLELLDLVRRTVAAEDDLLLRVVERVERMKELRLRSFLPGEELDVIDEQDVDAAVALAEVEDAVVPYRVDHLVHEPLGRDVGQLERLEVIEHVVPDRMHEVRLAQTHAAVNEQRVVRA